nr:hypothetical protein Iba_chr13aCG0780 [Ipomoea batatas]
MKKLTLNALGLQSPPDRRRAFGIPLNQGLQFQQQKVFLSLKGNRNQASVGWEVACSCRTKLEWSWKKVVQLPWCPINSQLSLVDCARSKESPRKLRRGV